MWKKIYFLGCYHRRYNHKWEEDCFNESDLCINGTIRILFPIIHHDCNLAPLEKDDIDYAYRIDRHGKTYNYLFNYFTGFFRNRIYPKLLFDKETLTLFPCYLIIHLILWDNKTVFFRLKLWRTCLFMPLWR